MLGFLFKFSKVDKGYYVILECDLFRLSFRYCFVLLLLKEEVIKSKEIVMISKTPAKGPT